VNLDLADCAAATDAATPGSPATTAETAQSTVATAEDTRELLMTACRAIEGSESGA
jgi:hypothetical protein